MSNGFWNAGYFNLGLFVPAGTAATLFEAIRERLLSIDELASLTDVFNRTSKAGAVFPYVIVSEINALQNLNTGGSYEDIPEYQFTTLANDDVTAKTLGETAFDFLAPSDSNPPLVWNEGIETVRLPAFKDRFIREPGRDRWNRPVWSYTFGYRILTSRAR